MKKACFYETAIGRIGIAEKDGRITNVFFGNTVLPGQYITEETPLLKEAVSQLKDYFSGKRKGFDLPLAPEGTPFEIKVWNALIEIPYGEIRTYGEIAEITGNPKACRAVGRANGLNPLSIFIPCHRVIGKSGKLTGYAGGVEAKEFLLDLEQKHR